MYADAGTSSHGHDYGGIRDSDEASKKDVR